MPLLHFMYCYFYFIFIFLLFQLFNPFLNLLYSFLSLIDCLVEIIVPFIKMYIERLKISKYAQSYLLPHFCILLINLFVYFLINKIVSTASFQRAREEATHSCIQCIYCLGPLSIFAAPDTGNGLLTHYYGCM